MDLPTLRQLLCIFILSSVGFACGPLAANLDEQRQSRDNGIDLKTDAAANCSVKDNQDGTFTMTCPDGTSVTWKEGTEGKDGQDGKPGTNGTNGTNGSNGADGSSCNVTDNGNGTYSMTCTNGSEVTWSNAGTAPTLIPNGALIGSYILENSLDIAFMQAVTWVTGSLTISADGLIDVALPKLQGVGGSYIISRNNSLTSFPVIGKIAADLRIIDNSKLTSFALPVSSVGGKLEILYNDALTSFDLAALTLVGGSLEIKYNPTLTNLDLTALTSVISSFEISDNDALPNIEVAALTLVGISLEIVNNPMLTSFDLPALISVLGNLRISDNNALTTFGLAALQTVNNDFYFRASSICKTTLDALVLQITFVGSTNVSGKTDGC